MEVVNILQMNPGDGESSYAKNSLLQKTAIQKTLPVLRQAIKGITKHDLFFGQCFKMVDMGCSSSKNTLLVASYIIDTIIELCNEKNLKPPQFQVCLNDLVGNDFNVLFKLLPDFYETLKKEKGENSCHCFVSAVPGSFYCRLFPDQSLHLVHSSYSVHWLSQVPEGLESNTLNIYMAKTSPPKVFQAYGNQFKIDFTKFLQMRSKEIICGGRMVLTFVGRSVDDPTSEDGCRVWNLLAQSLLEMVKEGLIQESDVNSFNVPTYFPCETEVTSIIQNEGSFSFVSFTTFHADWDPRVSEHKNLNDYGETNHKRAENITKSIRAITEPLFTCHFGISIIDGLFTKYRKHVARLSNNEARFFSFAISLEKK